VSDYPQRLDFDVMTYILRPDLHAVHEIDGEVAAHSGSPEGRLPVYESENGRLVFPTGKVWVRFARETDVRDRAADLAAAGYSIENVPGYAPHGAFVVGEDAAAALNGLERLRALEGVEHVEPQVVQQAARR
jgi:hypothetical protein